jgi:POT family proton-dependent oligopeptide transporter
MDIVWQAGIFITAFTAIPVLWQLTRGHPRGLFILFFAEMWERFSYYGMRGLLIFFMTQQFLFDDAGTVRSIHFTRLPVASDRRIAG